MPIHLLNQLYQQLCQFGLNSREWTIKPIQKNRFEIFHCKDPDFKFIGETKRQAWSRIWLQSL